MLICTSKSGFNVPDNQVTNQVPANLKQQLQYIVVAVLKVLVKF